MNSGILCINCTLIGMVRGFVGDLIEVLTGDKNDHRIGSNDRS